MPDAEKVPDIERIMDVLNVHRWASMGISSVACECGMVCEGSPDLTSFPADEAFRRHLAAEIVRATSPEEER